MNFLTVIFELFYQLLALTACILLIKILISDED
jgi:hypothetical protein